MIRCIALACALIWPAAALAQTGRVAVDGEVLRAAPDGAILATLEEGTLLRLGRRQGSWQEVTLEAWIWHQSVRAERNGPHDLVISAQGGENLRAAPNGALLAYGRTGMRLEQVERAGNWIRIRRTGWMREAGVRPDQAVAVERPAAGSPGTGSATAGSPAGGSPTAPAPAATRQASSATEPAPSAVAPAARASVGPAGSVLLTGPGADTLARLRPGAALSTVERQGEWVRVRLEGWIPAATLAGDSAAASDILVDIPAAALAEDPGAFAGRTVEWSLQFIALQRAEPIRTDFRTGEHFILARGPAGETGFVYIAVPTELLAEVERIPPLSRLRVRARIRNARSPLTEAPILELLEIRSVRRGDG
ncbi:MAG TPA: hypothetical protein VIL18_13735 [Longimicrobiales bacterium]